jgi:hypothetical protein
MRKSDKDHKQTTKLPERGHSKKRKKQRDEKRKKKKGKENLPVS